MFRAPSTFLMPVKLIPKKANEFKHTKKPVRIWNVKIKKKRQRDIWEKLRQQLVLSCSHCEKGHRPVKWPTGYWREKITFYFLTAAGDFQRKRFASTWIGCLNFRYQHRPACRRRREARIGNELFLLFFSLIWMLLTSFAYSLTLSTHCSGLYVGEIT